MMKKEKATLPQRAVTSGVELGDFCTNAFGDRFLKEVNHSCFQRISAETAYAERFRKELFSENGFFLIVGTDSGLLPQFVQQRGVPKGSRFIFVDLADVLERLSGEGLFDELDHRIAIVPFEQLDDQFETFCIDQYIYIDKLYLIDAFCVQDAHIPAYRDMFTAIKQKVEALHWQTKAELGNREFLLRQMENLPENQVPGNCLRGAFAGKTAVLIGGGPSLDDMLPWIREHADDLIVLAVSRASRRLLQVGITPHFVFSIDPQAVSFDVSREMLNLWEKSVFVNFFHTCPPLVGQWRGRRVFLGQSVPWESEFNVSDFICPGPTVTHFALEAGLFMGVSQVVLAGVDLCFSREGHTHAKGSMEREVNFLFNRETVEVETNGGWIAETTPAYFSGIEAMGAQAARAGARGAQVINPAVGAAKIPSVDYCPIAEIEVAKLEKPVSEILAKKLPEDGPEQRLAHYRALERELIYGRTRLLQIRRLAADALDANDGLFGRNGKKADFKYKKRMDQIEKRLKGEYKKFSELVKGFGIEYFFSVLRPDRDKDWTDEEVEEVGRLYYEAYRSSANLLIAIVEEALARLKSRFEEESPHPNPELLLQQWAKDRMPGRVVLWRSRNPDAYAALPETFRPRFEAMETEFNDLMACKIHLTGPGAFAAPPDFPGARTRGADFFHQRNIPRLENLMNTFLNSPFEESKVMYHLIRGYLAEVKGETDTAFEAYHQVIESETHPYLEDALKRVASLSLSGGHYEEAMLALECLSGISTAYVPQHADLLRLMGRHREALDIYADYMGKVPEDLSSMLKLGMYYLELGVEEGARMAFEYILEKDPANTSAAKLLGQIGKNDQGSPKSS